MKKLQVLVCVLLVLSLLSVPLVGCAAKELTLTVYTPKDGATRRLHLQ